MEVKIPFSILYADILLISIGEVDGKILLKSSKDNKLLL